MYIRSIIGHGSRFINSHSFEYNVHLKKITDLFYQILQKPLYRAIASSLIAAGIYAINPMAAIGSVPVIILINLCIFKLAKTETAKPVPITKTENEKPDLKTKTETAKPVPITKTETANQDQMDSSVIKPEKVGIVRKMDFSLDNACYFGQVIVNCGRELQGNIVGLTLISFV